MDAPPMIGKGKSVLRQLPLAHQAAVEPRGPTDTQDVAGHRQVVERVTAKTGIR